MSKKKRKEKKRKGRKDDWLQLGHKPIRGKEAILGEVGFDGSLCLPSPLCRLVFVV